MSRILKRPMFKKGGSTGEGIMTGLVTRTKHADQPMVSGTNRPIDPAMLRSDTKAILDALNQFAPLPKTRLPFGPVGFALTQGATPIEALGVGYGAFTKADDARRKLLASRKGAAVTAGIQRQLGKGTKGMFASDALSAQYANKLKVYANDSQPSYIRKNAQNLAAFETYTAPKRPRGEYVQAQFITEGGKTAATVDFLKPGQFTYDPISNTVFERTKEGKIRRLSPFDLKPLEKVDGTES
tara:strand:- start:91 stop:813 length:723 start_codon:yes stop_codon:yes gene_type:complete